MTKKPIYISHSIDRLNELCAEALPEIKSTPGEVTLLNKLYYKYEQALKNSDEELAYLNIIRFLERLEKVEQLGLIDEKFRNNFKIDETKERLQVLNVSLTNRYEHLQSSKLINDEAFNTEPSPESLSPHFNNLTPNSKEVSKLETRSDNPPVSLRSAFKDDMIFQDHPFLTNSLTKEQSAVVPSMLRGELHNSSNQMRPASFIGDLFSGSMRERKEPYQCSKGNLLVKNRINVDIANFDIQDSDKLDTVNSKTDDNEELINKIRMLEMQNNEQNEILKKKQKAIDLMRKKIEQMTKEVRNYKEQLESIPSFGKSIWSLNEYF